MKPSKRNEAPAGEVRMVQLVVATWDGVEGRTYSTLALGEDGVVYRYDPKCEGWIAWSMRTVGCRLDHKGRR